MKLSVSEVSKLLGISIRTLHYYDEIGLVRPSEISQAGYRFYDDENLSLLQQVMFYRELEFSLHDISDIISRPDYDKKQALMNHRGLLEIKKRHIDDLLMLVDETLGGKEMKKHTIEDIEKEKAKYAEETAERWGKTDAYKENRKREESYTDEKKIRIAEEADEIFAQFAANSDKSPSDADVQKLVERWRQHISDNHYPCTKEILACLGQMYVADNRFTENLDKFSDGTAAFMSEAIAVYCSKKN